MGKGDDKMNIAQPIRNLKDLKNMKKYYSEKDPNLRNYLLVIMGLNTALRVSDILDLKWGDVYDFMNMNFREHIFVVEKKTGKSSKIYMNHNIREALELYKEEWLWKRKKFAEHQYLFSGRKLRNKPITRVQAYRIIKDVAENCNMTGVVSCHSLRKTFGYHAWKQGVPPVLLMNIYNHSSFQVTQRYLGIEQDDRDKVFREIRL